jgi:hypothetical protein
MSHNHSNKPRTQILDLIDDSSQLSVLSQSDLQLVKGGFWAIASESCSCAAGGGLDYDNYHVIFAD